MLQDIIKTPETHPNHPVVGHYFKGLWSGIFYCDSYDPSVDYWMTCVKEDPESHVKLGERRDVSVRAIGRTYHKLRPHELEKLMAELNTASDTNKG